MILTIIIGLLLNVIAVTLFYHYIIKCELETVMDLFVAIFITIFSFIPFVTLFLIVFVFAIGLFFELMSKEL